MKQHFEAMKKAGASLALFAFISVVLVSTTNSLTKHKIEENQAKLLLKALNQIAPKNSYDNDLANSKIIIEPAENGFIRETPVYLATLKGKPVTAIFEVTTLKGYSGAITFLLGINADDKSVAGLRVVSHHETPGLGDKMEIRKSDWVLGFDGKSLGNPDIEHWHVKKDGGDFDQFTGATITPRAIVNATRSTLLYAQENMDRIFMTHLNSVPNSNKQSKNKGTQ
ncbi:electron transport complex subunit RsxG [Cocleimonas sp. KMM 6892]|uniref:electron transport complex subunit RsxG n=1 Tax=unclassified Cocleimonas TaxID=2639732 RepID=UPI002DBB4900|nr:MULTISPECIES: electron transport complex subunit RsxG [unclassified Cocleimonas]MEB8432339.1 electron transport complex subunit RsxG [Cocleimonas sp. KMM 6892]MEC4714575.1 electron transport complex subunit RsxG [Cocleimonas sp. KMM 6895]MEC4744611.1 electron transport complex subunit RsxG [Cocleimonas sp. KMM 6896]